MADIDNLVLENLKKIQGELSAARERDREILSRLVSIETLLGRNEQRVADNYGEIIHDRHEIDKLKDRLERIEKRLELIP